MYLLGCLQFEKGFNDRDESLGRLYLFCAAIHGYDLAQEKYAQVIVGDKGRETNVVEATAFFKLAASRSGLTQESKDLLKGLGKSLTLEQRLRVAQRVTELQRMLQEQKSSKVTTPFTIEEVLKEAKKLNAPSSLSR